MMPYICITKVGIYNSTCV